MPAGLVFPFDFGMIPGTKGEDGDPLDIIVISECSSFPGCLIDCRGGAIKAMQTEKNGDKMRNDRFVGVPLVFELFKDISDIDQLPRHVIDQIEVFFKNYNAQAGKKFKVLQTVSAKKAARKLEA